MQAHSLPITHGRRPASEVSTPPAPYCPLPRRMLSDLRDNPLAIGLYLLLGRLYLISHRPIPLGRAYDPSLKTGAVKRAFDRLLVGGWLATSTIAGSPKRRYTPTWGAVGGAVRPWCLDVPALGQPRHLATVRLNRDLLDVGLGRISPHPRHAAEITRYLVAPVLSLGDLGAYTLVLAGLGSTTSALTTLGLVEDGQVSAVPPAPRLLQQLARRSGIALSAHGRRKLGVREQEQSAVIGRQIGELIGDLIGSAPERDRSFSAAERPESPQLLSRPSIPGISSDSSDSPTPPPTPAAPGGGGRVLRGRQAERPQPAPVPETEATRLLGTIAVRPAQQIELASMPSAAVEQAIADGRARQGVRDLAGWVVYLLRQRRDTGWTPPPPTPRPDAPEVLAAYFREQAAEQEGERGAEGGVESLAVADEPPVPTPPPAHAAQPRSLAELWQDTLAGLRLRLPRELYQTCLRQAILVSCTADATTIGVRDTRTKEQLERSYSGALRFTLGDALGHDVSVRVVLRMLTSASVNDA